MGGHRGHWALGLEQCTVQECTVQASFQIIANNGSQPRTKRSRIILLPVPKKNYFAPITPDFDMRDPQPGAGYPSALTQLPDPPTSGSTRPPSRGHMSIIHPRGFPSRSPTTVYASRGRWCNSGSSRTSFSLNMLTATGPLGLDTLPWLVRVYIYQLTLKSDWPRFVTGRCWTPADI